MVKEGLPSGPVAAGGECLLCFGAENEATKHRDREFDNDRNWVSLLVLLESERNVDK